MLAFPSNHYRILAEFWESTLRLGAYDKKRSVERKKVKDWLKSVSAFANRFVGTLIWGITNDNEVVGLDDAKSNAEFISETIGD